MNTHQLTFKGQNKEKRLIACVIRHVSNVWQRQGTSGMTPSASKSIKILYFSTVTSEYFNQESTTGTSVNPFRFVGQWGYYDDSARGSGYGFLLLGARYYWPEYGRFLTWDPARIVPFYSYVSNRVLSYIDPFGFAGEIPQSQRIEENPCSRLRGFKGACIAMLCSLRSADALRNIVKGLGNIEGIKDIHKIIKNDPFTSAEDCCRKASSGGSGVPWAINLICSHMLGKPWGATKCSSITSNSDDCLECCEWMHAKDSTVRGQCQKV